MVQNGETAVLPTVRTGAFSALAGRLSSVTSAKDVEMRQFHANNFTQTASAVSINELMTEK